jgi:hypothetical protein
MQHLLAFSVDLTPCIGSTIPFYSSSFSSSLFLSNTIFPFRHTIDDRDNTSLVFFTPEKSKKNKFLHFILIDPTVAEKKYGRIKLEHFVGSLSERRESLSIWLHLFLIAAWWHTNLDVSLQTFVVE